MTLAEADAPARARTRRSTSRARWPRWPSTCARCSRCRQRGAVDVRLRQQHPRAGAAGRRRRRVRHPRLRARVHPPALLRGQGAVPLGRALGRSRRHPRHRRGGARDVRATTRRCAAGSTWRASASRSRGCRRASAGSATASARASACGSTNWCASGRIKAPIVIGRDHLDTGSVASPNRETEGMRDGSDAIADWPMLNALLNASAGATWVSVHHGGGVGIGYSLHAGMVIVADGTRDADEKLERVLTCDPGIGVVRHADAGYPEAHRHRRARTVFACRCGRSAMLTPRSSLARRVLAALDASPSRIPVLARRLRQRPHDAAAAAARSHRPDRRRSTSTSSARRRRPSGSCRAVRRGVAVPGHRRRAPARRARRRSTRRSPSSTARARPAASRPRSCSTSSSSCGRSRASRACAACCASCVDGLAASGNRFVLTSRYVARALRAAARRLGALRGDPHAAARRPRRRLDMLGSAPRQPGDAHDAEYLARTVQALADGRPAYVRALADELAAVRDARRPRRRAIRSARSRRCSRPTAALARQCALLLRAAAAPRARLRRAQGDPRDPRGGRRR